MPSRSPATPKARTRDAGQTREQILNAARTWFSSHSYENVGTRDIAREAGVDAALVNRYFGSKEKLFAEAIEGGFRVEDHLPADITQLGDFLVNQVLADADEAQGFDALRVLLRATGNPPIAAMVSERFHREFIEPLGKRLAGEDAQVRAGLIASYVIGLATLRHGLGSALLQGDSRQAAATRAAAAIQACVKATE